MFKLGYPFILPDDISSIYTLDTTDSMVLNRMVIADKVNKMINNKDIPLVEWIELMITKPSDTFFINFGREHRKEKAIKSIPPGYRLIDIETESVKYGKYNMDVNTIADCLFCFYPGVYFAQLCSTIKGHNESIPHLPKKSLSRSFVDSLSKQDINCIFDWGNILVDGYLIGKVTPIPINNKYKYEEIYFIEEYNPESFIPIMSNTAALECAYNKPINAIKGFNGILNINPYFNMTQFWDDVMQDLTI